jgi:hypothetical protein
MEGRSSERFIPRHGGYRRLLSHQKVEIVYDATVRFCDRFVDRRSRTHDQMIQAARSGKQNIVEASMASATSKDSTGRSARWGAFVREGGLRERMARARRRVRDRA